jgi:hypothetical protein
MRLMIAWFALKVAHKILTVAGDMVAEPKAS